MGIEMISNTVASYKEVPKDAAPKTEPKQVEVRDYSNTTQKIVESETQAVKHGDNDGSGQGTGGNLLSQEDESTKEQQIKNAVRNANQKLKTVTNTRTHCEFAYHEETKRVSIKIKDDETGEVIKEIPPEETLDMIGKMWEMAGLFVDDRR